MKYSHLRIGDTTGLLKIISSSEENKVGKFVCFCIRCMGISVIRKDSILGREDCGCGKSLFGFGISDLRKGVNPSIKSVWEGMLKRCFYESESSQDMDRTYRGITSVCDEWRYFSNFNKWAEPRYAKGLHLDKDLKVLGNKIYSPDTCLFVSKEVNNFLTLRGNDRGDYPLGVSWHKRDCVFQGTVSINNKRHSKYFSTKEEAHAFWQEMKSIAAKKLAIKQTNPDVADALIRVSDKLKKDWEEGRETTFTDPNMDVERLGAYNRLSGCEGVE